MQRKGLDTPKDRNYGIDLLRIVSMYMIVIIHLLHKSGILEKECSRFVTIINIFLLSLVFCCVNCYALISGYVGYKVNSRYNFEAYLNLWFQVVFYGITILVFLKMLGMIEVTSKDFIVALFPVTRDQYWYFTAYTGVFFIMPLINKAVESMEAKEMKVCCIIGIFVFSVYSTFAQNLGGDPFDLNEGLGFVWLSLLYFFGAVIKKHHWELKLLSYKNARTKLSLVCVVCVILTAGCFFITKKVTFLMLGYSWGEDILMSYISPTILCLSICLLVLFSGISVGKKTICFVKFCAPATFGVYLIHMQPLVAKYILGTYFMWISELPGLFSTITILGISLIILASGILIDRCRILLFKVCRIGIMTSNINRIIWKIMNILFD